jgi:hypothetical protein
MAAVKKAWTRTQGPFLASFVTDDNQQLGVLSVTAFESWRPRRKNFEPNR